MKVLVIGGGGREHALAWKLANSPRVETVFCAPGSDGMVPPAQRVELAPLDFEGLVRFAVDQRVDLTVVGPEAPLVAGIVDRFQSEGLAVVGPSASAARLEGSKVFAKEFMRRHAIPTARYAVCGDPASARLRLEAGEFSYPLVIKADGLAAGKGVIIAADAGEARAAIDRIMAERAFGPAGDRVVLEEFLTGEEASFMVFTDGEAIAPMVPAQDHKRRDDGDRGPNTGGLGAYSDDRILPPALRDEIMAAIVIPTVRGMAAEGSPFRGILYAGLMLTERGPRVLEYNVRFGDPETQVVLPRLKTDLADIGQALAQGCLAQVSPEWDPRPAVCVVLAAGGYPGDYDKGRQIHGLDMAAQMPGVVLFHAGTRREHDRWLTNGGRVLGVTGAGAVLPEAVMRAYEAVNCIHFEGMHYRRDIGAKGLGRWR